MHLKHTAKSLLLALRGVQDIGTAVDLLVGVDHVVLAGIADRGIFKHPASAVDVLDRHFHLQHRHLGRFGGGRRPAAALLEVFDQKGRAVGLEGPRLHRVNQEAVAGVGAFIERTVVAVTSAEAIPQRIDPDAAAAAEFLFEKDHGRVLVIAVDDFEHRRVEPFHVFVDALQDILPAEIDFRHDDHFPFVGPQLLFNLPGAFAAFQDDLVQGTGLLRQGDDLVKIVECLVEIEQDATLARQQDLLQCRNLRGGFQPATAAEIFPLQPSVAGQGDQAPAGGSRLDARIVHQHQHAVQRAPDVHFHDIYPHADGKLDRLQGILRGIAPVTAMRRHKHCPVAGRQQMPADHIDPRLCRGSQRTEKQNKGYDE